MKTGCTSQNHHPCQYVVATDNGCKFETGLNRDLLNVLVIQELVRICTKIAYGSEMTKVAFRLAPPNGWLPDS